MPDSCGLFPLGTEGAPRHLSKSEAQLLDAAGYIIKLKTGTARILGSHTITQVYDEEGLLVGAFEEFSGDTVEIRASHGARIQAKSAHGGQEVASLKCRAQRARGNTCL